MKYFLLIMLTFSPLIYHAATYEQPKTTTDFDFEAYIDSVNRCNNNPTLMGCNDPYYN